MHNWMSRNVGDSWLRTNQSAASESDYLKLPQITFPNGD